MLRPKSIRDAEKKMTATDQERIESIKQKARNALDNSALTDEQANKIIDTCNEKLEKAGVGTIIKREVLNKDKKNREKKEKIRQDFYKNLK